MTRTRRAFAALGMITSCTAGVSGCGAGRATEPDDGHTGPMGGLHEDPNFSREALLRNLGEKVLATYQEFDDAAVELVGTTEAYASSLGENDRLAAQDSWRAAITIWQHAELFRFGPAGELGVAVGGEGLADEIYSWSVSTNTCRIDQETIEETFRDADVFAEEAINVRGLDALEYLLFADSDDNTCAVNLGINTDGSWEARRAEVPQLRADYARAAAEDVARSSRALVEAWDPAEGDFLGVFAGAGDGTSGYGSPQAVLSAIGDAMFYLDVQTKDRKLGVPSGLMGCETTTCPDQVESPFARYSREHIMNNLEGFELLLSGGHEDAGGFGMGDQLRDVGAASLGEAMGDDLDSAKQAVRDIGADSLTDALSSSLESVHRAFDAVKQLTDQLKTEFVEELELDITSAGPGDAD